MSWLGGLVDNVKDFFGDLADNAEALFSGEKKVFGKNVNKKEKKGNAKKKSKVVMPIIKGDGKSVIATSSGKTYKSASDYLQKRIYAKKFSMEHPWQSFHQRYQQFQRGEISYDELYRYVPSYQKQQRIENQREYNEKYAEEQTSYLQELNKGVGHAIGKAIELIQYNGVIEGLYNLTDDDPNTTFLSGLKKGVRQWNPAINDTSKMHSFSDVMYSLKYSPWNLIPVTFNFLIEWIAVWSVPNLLITTL